MTLGQRLKEARLKAGYKSQTEAAKKLGITSQVLSNYEGGRRDPDTQTLKALAELYNVSADYLLGTEKKKPSKLDESINEAIEELKKEETLLLMRNADIDEETAQLIKQALINGIKYVDAMKKKKE
ncbi:helix-turn-helix domain-containing protein [Bacillus subtilis]|uniref:Helix-turn-helix domain-containing protein n=1 Tax=Bacillus subtilis TaxID=1423 RepID=A0AC61YWX9_BACIU|nr:MULTISPECIES: helix-turn-helix transcriptional regulator [Bacillus subtilis group]AYK66849.1 XRE family transcriptional regulator [Bacillus subtilis subsp. subtilis]MBK4205456.1 XRE family transcriptional regulator [Bacillus subtilis]MCB4339257.1 HTH-type transcriptional regulator ImmR [Bacillus subtilis]MCY9368862.1 helix-turn-helix domain-containing protein [Bacillus spizizenii]MDH3146492.1 helix-turn-helix transcriptional regulator [Bacillus subtilis]